MSLKKRGRSKLWVVFLTIAVAICFTSVVIADGVQKSAFAYSYLAKILGGLFGMWGLFLLVFFALYVLLGSPGGVLFIPYLVAGLDSDELGTEAEETDTIGIYNALDAQDLGDVEIRHTFTLDDGTTETITQPLVGGTATLTQGGLSGIVVTTSYQEDNYNDHFVSNLTVPKFTNCTVNRRITWKTEVVSASDPTLVSNARWQVLEFGCATDTPTSPGFQPLASTDDTQPLTFNLLISGYDPFNKPHVTPWSTGDVLVNLGAEMYSSATIADGLVSFTVPRGEDTTVTFGHPTFGLFTLDFSFASGFLTITDPANRDQTVNYFDNGDGTYALDYFDPATRLLMTNQHSGVGAPVQGPTFYKIN